MMSPEEFLEKYLEPDNFGPVTGKVIQSVFSTDARFQNGQQMLLIWTIETADGSTRDQFWGVGKVGSGWHSPDGGTTVANRDGKKLHGLSGYFRGVLTPCAKWNLGSEIEAAGGPMNAKAWVGTSWTVGSEKVDFKGTGDDGQPIGARDLAVLVEYLGGFGTAPVAAPATVTGKFDELLATLTQTERAFLEEQAKQGGNLSDWAITNMPGKMSDPGFMAAIVDPEFKNALLGVF